MTLEKIWNFISLLKWGNPVEILGSIITILVILTAILTKAFGLFGGDPTTLPSIAS